MYKCYLVEGTESRIIYAIFRSAEDAKLHQQSVSVPTRVVERSLFTGQANCPGFNK